MHVEGTSSTFISTSNLHSHFQTALTFEIIELEAVVDSETICSAQSSDFANYAHTTVVDTEFKTAI